MATKQADGSIKLKDGRLLYANSLVFAQDLIEVVPLLVPPPAWPFVSGGGGGGVGLQGPAGPAGSGGGQGAQGDLGPQGFQGDLGPQGNQGNFGVQGFQGTNPGPQGNQGPQGPQGLVGGQGFQGNIGPQGTTTNAVNLQFGASSQVGSGGTLQLEGPGTSLVGITLVHAGTITGGSLTVNSASGNSYNLDIRINGSSVATVALTAGNTSAFSDVLAAPVVAGDILTVFMVRTSGSGPSGFANMQALVEISS